VRVCVRVRVRVRVTVNVRHFLMWSKPTHSKSSVLTLVLISKQIVVDQKELTACGHGVGAHSPKAMALLLCTAGLKPLGQLHTIPTSTSDAPSASTRNF
jgi:hypothetical protein